MNTDIRIATSFKGHRKRKKLSFLLGEEATGYLIDLWIGTAMNHPTGTLKGMTEIDIALEADWKGDPNIFVGALLECNLLKKTKNGTFQLHDWEEHQQYVIHAPERKKKARKAAEKKWEKRKSVATTGVTGDATSIPVAMPVAMPGAMLDSNFSNAPSPSPSPSPAPAPAPSPSPEPRTLGQKIIAASPPDAACAEPEMSPEKYDATPTEREALHVLSTAKGGYSYDYDKDLAQIRKLSVEFPRVDMLLEVKKMADWLVDKPPDRLKNSRAFMRNWITKAAEGKPRASPVTVNPAQHGVPDPADIKRRFNEKYSNTKTGGVVIDV
jgi:hypothetical protein